MSRSQEKLADATKGKENCHAVAVDAVDPESVREGMSLATSLLGGSSLDLVVYCPGYFGPETYGSFERLFDSGDWDRGWDGSVNIHVKGMMNAFRHTRKALLRSDRGGVFVCLSSIAGSIGHPGAAMYAICKAAADHALKQLALEYAPLGLRVYSVAPGLIHTPAIEGLGPDTDEFLDKVGSSHAMKRYARPEEVGEVIAFLASERASFMTGGPIYVDGGVMLRNSLGDAIRPFFDEREQGGVPERKPEVAPPGEESAEAAAADPDEKATAGNKKEAGAEVALGEALEQKPGTTMNRVERAVKEEKTAANPGAEATSAKEERGVLDPPEEEEVTKDVGAWSFWRSRK